MMHVEEGKKMSRFGRSLPALTLMLLSPLIAEVLSGATRVSAMFVFPIEVLIWGGGAVLIRYFVRRAGLGWRNLVLLAMALAVAEEVLIQQTSVAPLVIQLKGVEYARAMGFNYVYFSWALLYEVLFVVVVPIALTELIFFSRRDESWLNRTGVLVLSLLFVPACLMAWFTWTQIARVKVFHLAPYSLPKSHALVGVFLVLALIGLALGPGKRALAAAAKPLKPLPPFFVFLLSALVSVVIFGVEILAFGIKPNFPPLVAVAVAIFLGLLLVVFTPRMVAHDAWNRWHGFAGLYGAMLGNFAIMFVAFIGATRLDLYGKIILDFVALVLMVWFMILRTRKAQVPSVGI